MANNPKKVKDPTEVALSAIQEALNISDTTVDTSRNSLGNELAPSDVRRLRRPIPNCLLTSATRAERGAAGVRSDRRAAQPPSRRQ